MFPWEKILFLSSVAAMTALAVFVLVRGRKDLIHITFSLFLFSVAALAINVYLVRIAQAQGQVTSLHLLGRLSFAIGGVNCAALWALTEVFPRIRHQHRVQKRLVSIYAVGLFAFAIAMSPWHQTGIRDMRPVLGWAAIPWVGTLLFCLSASFYNLFSNYRQLPKGHLRNQVRYTFLGLLLLAFPAAIFSILLPSLGNVSFTSLVPFFGTITAVILTYAVVRHRLMDLGIVFRNALIYGASVCSVAVLVVGFHILFSSALGFPSTLSLL